MSLLKGFLTRVLPVFIITGYMVFIMNIFVIGDGGDDVEDISSRSVVNGLPNLDNLVVLSDEPQTKKEKITTPVFGVKSSTESSNTGSNSTGTTVTNVQMPKKQISVTISAAGDCTFGRDDKYSFEYSFDSDFDINNNDYTYFLKNVSDIFGADDFTFVNLEGALTTSTDRADKSQTFKGSPDYVNILTSSSVEAVTLANDHVGDYLQAGYEETINTVIDAGLKLCGEGFSSTYDANGIKIGIMSSTVWSDSQDIRDKIHKAIQGLKDEGADLIIAYFHWGTELSYNITEGQSSVARYAIDCGVNLVLGSHPHVIQPIEIYNGKRIVYSLGNLCYGGSKNPVDKDAIIYQQKFTFEDGELLNDDNFKIIPISISSVENRNNYQPTPATGDEYSRIRDKILNDCKPFLTGTDDENALTKAFGG